ncbi:unnamed protein product [Rotaria magnacalcarata]
MILAVTTYHQKDTTEFSISIYGSTQLSLILYAPVPRTAMNTSEIANTAARTTTTTPITTPVTKTSTRLATRRTTKRTTRMITKTTTRATTAMPVTITVNIPANAKWAHKGVTITGGHGVGDATNQVGILSRFLCW